MSLAYRDMLSKYMRMAGEIEGATFSSYWDGYFTPEEIQFLEEIESEI